MISALQYFGIAYMQFYERFAVFIIFGLQKWPLKVPQRLILGIHNTHYTLYISYSIFKVNYFSGLISAMFSICLSSFFDDYFTINKVNDIKLFLGFCKMFFKIHL